MEVQTRSEENGIRHFKSIKEAMDYAKSDPTVWKVSFSVGDEQVRLVKRDDGFMYEPLKLVNNHYHHYIEE